WRAREGRAAACPGVSAHRCMQVESAASTLRLRDCLNCVPPHRTAAVMAPNDIVIQLSIAREHPAPIRRTFAWPPRIRHASGPVEGLTEPVGGYSAATQVGGREVFLYVFFGRAVPTKRQLALANAGL